MLCLSCWDWATANVDESRTCLHSAGAQTHPPVSPPPPAQSHLCSWHLSQAFTHNLSLLSSSLTPQANRTSDVTMTVCLLLLLHVRLILRVYLSWITL